MNRSQLVRQLAEIATRPLLGEPGETVLSPAPLEGATQRATELFVWFEDTATRQVEGRRGVAGLPESLLPYCASMRIVERRYAENHFHLLSAVRIACRADAADLISALYTSALSVGTVAWIGTGAQYERTWNDMYPSAVVSERSL